MNILVALLALSFLIIVHELGHFTVAKLSGIKVHEFALFMGPKLFSIQRGETTYSIRLIPLGGFVKMEGEEQESTDERAFNRKPIYVRAAVIAAGPIMNLLTAILIVTVIITNMGFNTTEIRAVQDNAPAQQANIQVGDRIVRYDNHRVYHPMDVLSFLYASKGKQADVELIRDGQRINTVITPQVIPAQTRYLLGFNPLEQEGENSNVVGSVIAGYPGETAGLKPGDRIVRLNDQEVASRQEINDYLSVNKDAPVKVYVMRDDSPIAMEIKPAAIRDQEVFNIGLAFTNRKGAFVENIKQAFVYSYSTARSIIFTILWLITGTVSLNQVMGPVGIVNMIGDVVQQSPTFMDILINLLNITALISINLGIFNLIPFPALDGSKLLLLGIEGVRRKSIPPEKEAFISMIGFVLLIALMIFTTSNDIMRLIIGPK